MLEEPKCTETSCCPNPRKKKGKKQSDANKEKKARTQPQKWGKKKGIKAKDAAFVSVAQLADGALLEILKT